MHRRLATPWGCDVGAAESPTTPGRRERASGRRSAPSAALRIALIYALFGLAWIALSDRVVAGLAGDRAALESWQLAKGFAFVLATGVLCYVLVLRNARHDERMLALVAEREKYFRDLFERAPAAYQSLSADGVVLDVNQAWLDLLGYDDRADVVGRPFVDLVDPDDRDSLREQFARLEACEHLADVELTMRRRDGVRLHVLADGRRQPTAADHLPRTHCVLHDITARKRVEMALRDSEERLQRALDERVALDEALRHAQKLEAVGQLAGGVAHDFNNLLQVINGYTELVLEDVADGDARRGQLEEVARAGRRASELVAQLLAFSRRQVLRPEPLDLNVVVGDLVGIVERTLGEHVDVVWEPCAAPVPLRADRRQVEQCLMNLCLNARDAMPRGGHLRIATHDVTLTAEECRRRAWAQPGRWVRLTVTDEGVGLDPAELDRIWEPFFTTKQPGEGSGLGLSTVYGIVRQHDGLVRVASEPGRGTTFELYFSRLAGAPEPAVVSEEPVAGGDETILVAEDRADVRELMGTVLERAGYTVLMAADGRAALALLEARAHGIDLALLDVVMPGVGGREISDRVQPHAPDLRVVFVSGYDPQGIPDELRPEPGSTVIRKPFEVPELLVRVREALDRR